MASPDLKADPDWALELDEWREALAEIIKVRGRDAARHLVTRLQAEADEHDVAADPSRFNTPYRNSIPSSRQTQYSGDPVLEGRIECILRWNAACMVLKGVDSGTGVGGHIATYFSASTMLEVGFNHFFRAASDEYGGDQVHVQAHASPGVYARAFLEGRLTERQLRNFRRELQEGGGLPSYPHPRRMPGFWQMPTASMGLSTPCAIYQARFAKYLENRGLKPRNGGKIWLFVGDGETDEPEVLGTINIAARERLDNLVMVVNCNLQRLDGPVRGNGKIIQELERSFLGSGWRVLKVLWSSDWDRLLNSDSAGVLQRRMNQLMDGDYQLESTLSGAQLREHWAGDSQPLEELFVELSDDELRSLRRGGHDPLKIHAAFSEAATENDRPTVVLVKTVKGDGMGSQGAARNTAHQRKQLSSDERIAMARRFGVPLTPEQAANADFFRPGPDSAEIRYLKQRRKRLGGFLPSRRVDCPKLSPPPAEFFSDMVRGSGNRTLSTTMVLVRMLQRLLRDKEVGKFVVPIVPDEARTFGMDGLFAQAGIYSPCGQSYTPVDADTIAPYRESVDGQILQEGICEAGAMASFLAAGTAYANHGLPMIPFYIFYSIFGFQRIGDLIWAAGDMLCKGFLLGGTSGRTTLNGEGVQHQDGHSHVLASTVPNLRSYDPSFAFEIAIIVRDGIRRMYQEQEDLFYYLTLGNQNYAMPSMPENAETGILKGIHAFSYTPQADVNLFGSGAIMTEVLDAAVRLRELGKKVTVWSVTSYIELARDGAESDRQYLLNVGSAGNSGYLANALKDETGVFVAASDYQRSLPSSVAPWIPGPYAVLGTDGYGLSESRQDLRNHFQVSASWIVFTALSCLARSGRCDSTEASDYAKAADLQPAARAESFDPP